MSIQQSVVNFCAPEFGHVFKIILGKNNKDQFYQLRKLNKSFMQKFDETIDTVTVDVACLRSLVESNLANNIRYLTVQIPDTLRQLDQLHLILQTFLHNIVKVNVVFIPKSKFPNPQYQSFDFLTVTNYMRIFQPLVFRGINVVCDDTQRYLCIMGRFDVTIIDSNFCNFNLKLEYSNNILIKNTIFQFASNYGLYISKTLNTVELKEVQFLNCLQTGLNISLCNNINISGIRALNCSTGIDFGIVSGLNLIYSIVENCLQGFIFSNTDNSLINNCVFKLCQETAIVVQHSSVNYSGVYAENNSQDVLLNEGEFIEIQ